MASAAALAEISTDALMAEIQRRLECTVKPEKRIILIGARLTTQIALTVAERTSVSRGD